MTQPSTKIYAYLELMRLNKPIGSLLLLWPTLWALWLTDSPSLFMLSVFVAGVFIMRSAGCVINDYADRHLDGHVERTKSRPLASGKLTAKNALWTLVCLLALAFLLLLMLNKLAWLVATFSLILVLMYPFMKRITHLPQLFLGIAFSCAIPMVYAATIEQFPITCWLLFFANICWTIAYDTQYAMVDRDDDIKIGIKSTAILFGNYDKFIIGLLQSATIALLSFSAIINQLDFIFWCCLSLATCLFIYQQWLIKKRERDLCFKAFLNNNYVGCLIFIGILLSSTAPLILSN